MTPYYHGMEEKRMKNTLKKLVVAVAMTFAMAGFTTNAAAPKENVAIVEEAIELPAIGDEMMVVTTEEVEETIEDTEIVDSADTEETVEDRNDEETVDETESEIENNEEVEKVEDNTESSEAIDTESSSDENISETVEVVKPEETENTDNTDSTMGITGTDTNETLDEEFFVEETDVEESVVTPDVVDENAAKGETVDAAPSTEKTVQEKTVANSTMVGNKNTPYFKMDNGDTAYCVEAEKSHPTDGTQYEGKENTEVEKDYSSLKSVFVNKSFLEKENVLNTDLLNKVMQQVIWAKLSNNADFYRVNTRVWLGTEAEAMFDKLSATVDTSKFEVLFREYKTSQTDELGVTFQTLLSAYVNEIVQPTPDPVDPTPVVPVDPTPVNPEPTPDPVNPVDPTPVNPTPDAPKPSPVIEKSKTTPIVRVVRPTAETGVLTTKAFVGPQTGDLAPIAFYMILAIMSMAAIVVCSRRLMK